MYQLFYSWTIFLRVFNATMCSTSLWFALLSATRLHLWWVPPQWCSTAIALKWLCEDELRGVDLSWRWNQWSPLVKSQETPLISVPLYTLFSTKVLHNGDISMRLGMPNGIFSGKVLAESSKSSLQLSFYRICWSSVSKSGIRELENDALQSFLFHLESVIFWSGLASSFFSIV